MSTVLITRAEPRTSDDLVQAEAARRTAERRREEAESERRKADRQRRIAEELNAFFNGDVMGAVESVLLHPRYRANLRSLVLPSRTRVYAISASVLGGGLAMMLWLAGFTFLEVTTASILNQVSTIYIFILATLILKEPLTARRTAAIALALSGAFVVILGQPR